MRYLRALLFCVAASVFAACGGGSTPPTTYAPIPSGATTTATIPASGGTITASLGNHTATVTIPAGALSTAATVSLKVVSTSGLTAALAKARKGAQSVSPSATALLGIVIDAGGATITAPLQLSFGGLSAPASGTSTLLAGYGNSTYDDVDVMSFDGANYNTTTNPDYPGMTLASSTLYVMYSTPTTAVLTPTSAITVAGPASVGTAATGTYTATEATTNGFPFLGRTFTYSVDNAQLGTITSAGVLTGGGIGGVGNVVATDTLVSAFTGKLAVAVTSARPGAAGLTETYTGSLSEVDANNAISNAPVSYNTNATATLNVSAASATDGSGNVVFTANESDAASLTTLTSSTVSTVAYQQSGTKTNVRALKTVATESSGVVYEHDYAATNGLLTILPEAAGTFTNDAAEEYKETDPGIGITAGGAQGVTTDKVVAGSGTYTANIVEPNVFDGSFSTDVATEAANFSGTLMFNSIDPGAFLITYNPPANNTIDVNISDPNFGENSDSVTANWIPSSLASPSVETDSIAAVTALDQSCAPSAGVFSGSANLITQQLTIADVVNGTLETRTTKTYDVNGTGTVCTVVSDVIKTFYDYSSQQGSYLIYFANSATNPVLQTTINETLSLQTTNVAQVASTKRTSAATTGSTFALLPVSTVAAHVQHLAHARQAAQMTLFRKNAAKMKRGGSVK